MNTVYKDLNDIIEYLYDSHNGYREALDDIKNLDMKKHFETAASKRLSMIEELKKEVRAGGEEPKDSGSMAAMAHRMFVNMKTMFTNMLNGNEVQAVVEEIKRGESFTLDKYKEVLTHELPSSVKMLLEKQMNDIQTEVQNIKFSAA